MPKPMAPASKNLGRLRGVVRCRWTGRHPGGINTSRWMNRSRPTATDNGVTVERDSRNASQQVIVNAHHRCDGLGPVQPLGGDVKVFYTKEALGGHHGRFTNKWQRGPVVFADPEVLASGQTHPMVRTIEIAGLPGSQGRLSKGNGSALRGGIECTLGLFEKKRLGLLKFTGMEGNNGCLEEGRFPGLDVKNDIGQVRVICEFRLSGCGLILQRTWLEVYPKGGLVHYISRVHHQRCRYGRRTRLSLCNIAVWCLSWLHSITVPHQAYRAITVWNTHQFTTFPLRQLPMTGSTTHSQCEARGSTHHQSTIWHVHERLSHTA